MAWVGVAREMDDVLCEPYKASSKCYLVVFDSKGSEGLGGASPQGKAPHFDKLSASAFSSGQQLMLTLDTFKGLLSLSVNGVLVTEVRNLDVHGLRPFVCLESAGSVLLSADKDASKYSSQQSLITHDQKRAAFDNSVWSLDLDDSLRRIFAPFDYLSFVEHENKTAMDCGKEDPLVTLGDKFIREVRDLSRGERAHPQEMFSRLNALAGLNRLLQCMKPAADLANTGSSCGAAGQTAVTDKHAEIQAMTLSQEERAFIGGAVATRVNARVFLGSCLERITSKHIAKDRICTMIREGTDINATNKRNRNAVSLAAEKGHLDAVNMLIKAKADIEIRDEAELTVLHSAARAGNADLVMELVKSKADPNSLSQDEKTPLDLATSDECRFAFKVMGAGGWTALMVAAERGEEQVRQYLDLRRSVLCISQNWTWTHHSEFLVLGKDATEISNVSRESEFCAVGSDILKAPNMDYVWTLKTEGPVWVGLVNGIKSGASWCTALNSCDCDSMLAFFSGSAQVINTTKATFHPETFPGWETGQTLKLSFNPGKSHLDVFVDSKLIERVSGLGSGDFRPYICLGFCSKVQLLSSEIPSESFSREFQNDVRFYSSLALREISWNWGICHMEDMTLNDTEVRKTSTWHKYSCALGSDELTKGVHSWTLGVDCTQNMWAGIVRGLAACSLTSGPDQANCDFIAVFSSNGEFFCGGTSNPILEKVAASLKWSARQILELRLDLNKGTMELWMGSRLAAIVLNLNESNSAQGGGGGAGGNGVRPYVCLEYGDSATLLKRESLIVDASSSVVSFKDRAVGLDNVNWRDENLNRELVALPREGAAGNWAETILNYTKDDIHKLKEEIDCLPNKEIRFKICEKPLGAVATRLNVHATIHHLLCQVAEKSSVLLVKSLMLSRKDINAVNQMGRNALYIAAELGRMDAVKRLLQYDADLTRIEKEHGFSCLHAAAKSGNALIVEALINAGARVDATDKMGRTLIHVAAEVPGGAEVIQHPCVNFQNLFERGDLEGRTPLHVAAERGQEDFVRYLLEVGVDFNVEDHKGRSALSQTSSTAVKDLLKSVGADGWTPLMIVSEQGGWQFEDYLQAVACLRDLSEGKTLPGWFVRSLRFHSTLSTKESKWLWGPRELRNIQVSEDSSVVTKTTDYPDYSCVLGSTTFEEGIHKWTVRIENLQSCWLGIARGIEENDLLGRYPGDASYGTECFLLAFNSNGDSPIMIGRTARVELIENKGSFRSGQKVELELDMLAHTLTMKVDGMMAAFAKDVDDRGVRPYACMDYYEVLTLLQSSSRNISVPSVAWNWLIPKDGELLMSSCSVLRKRDADSSATTLVPQCALGDRRFEGGIHTWDFNVRNVRDMWIGVARGEEELLFTHSPEECGAGECVLALHCSGKYYNNFDNCKIRTKKLQSGIGFRSGQKIEVELSMLDNTLKIRVDDAIVLAAWGLEGSGFLPYVCIMSLEEVSIQGKSSRDLAGVKEEASWEWGAMEQHNLRLSPDNTCIVEKQFDTPDYSCVVGNEALDEGIHNWELVVDNVEAMWVGIARGVVENELLDRSARSVSGNAYVLAFGSGGGNPVCVGALWLHSTMVLGSSEFHSNQTLTLELNTFQHTLKFFIEGTLVVMVSNVDDRDVRPYLCMDYFESVKLGRRTKCLRSWKSVAIDDSDWHHALKSPLWTPEINEILIKHQLADEVRNYKLDDFKTFPDFQPPQALVDTVGVERLKQVIATRINTLAMVKKLLGMPPHSRLKSFTNVIKASLDFNAQNRLGFTALQVGAQAGQLEVVMALMQRQDVREMFKDEEVKANLGQRTTFLCALCSVNTKVLNYLMSEFKSASRQVAQSETHSVADVVSDNRNSQTSIHMCLQGFGVKLFNDNLTMSVSVEWEVRQVLFHEFCGLRSLFFCPPCKRAYFEVKLVRVGDDTAVGLVPDFWNDICSLGQDGHSWAATGRSWKDGDVVGVACDLKTGTVLVSINGRIENRQRARLKPNSPRMMAALVSSSAAVHFNFGTEAWQYAPPSNEESMLQCSVEELMGLQLK